MEHKIIMPREREKDQQLSYFFFSPSYLLEFCNIKHISFPAGICKNKESKDKLCHSLQQNLWWIIVESIEKKHIVQSLINSAI